MRPQDGIPGAAPSHHITDKLSISTLERTKCGFLKLPGELRNDIYNYLSAAIIHERLPNQEQKPQIRLHPSSQTRSPCKDWSTIRRQDLGLTQTCRLTRHEYSPIHSKHYTIHISLPHLASYAETLNPTQNIALPARHISIGIDYCPEAQRPNWHNSYIDVSPLLRALHRSPDLTLKFTAHIWFKDSYLQTLFSVRENEAWSACLESKIDCVWVWPELGHGAACAKVRIDVRSEWVEGDALWPRSARMRALYGWLEREGLGGLKDWAGLRLCASYPLPRALRGVGRRNVWLSG